MNKRALLLVGILILSVVNVGMTVSSASTIDTIDISPSQEIDGKLTTRGDVNISVIDEGDSDHCELWIDGSLYSYMDNVSGTYDWSYQINTQGFDDGAHEIQIRSIDGTGGTDIKTKQVWFDNTDPVLKNKSTVYPIGYDAAQDDSSVHIKAEVTDDVSGIDSVSVDASQFDEGILPMYDDGNHQDGAANDGVYCTPSFIVNGETSYKYLDINVEDKIGNNRTSSVELKLDNTKPTIRNLQSDLPVGQNAVKKGDEIRFTGNATDLKLKFGKVETQTPIDVAMVIDTSGSMDGQPLSDAKQAAKTFVGKLSSLDRAALYIFKPGSDEPQRKVDYMFMNDENKKSLNQTIENLTAEVSTLTPIWDTIGEATNYAWNNHLSQHTPAVVAMTDGDDEGAGDPGTEPEAGSETYSPGVRGSNDYGPAIKTWNMTADLEWGEEKTYDWNIARYRGSDGWEDIDLNDEDHDPTRDGLINSPVPTFNIGLGMDPQGSNSSADNYLDPNSTVSDIGGTPSDINYVKSDSYAYNFTTEYDLKEIANSTGGGYNYAPTSSELVGIYENISQEIEDIGQRWVGEEAPHGLNRVYIDAEELGVSTPVAMYDDGNHGDGNAGDNIYGTEYFTVKSEQSKSATVNMVGEDQAGNVNQTFTSIQIDNSDPDIISKTIEYPAGQDFVTEGQEVNFEVETQDAGSDIDQLSLDATAIGGASNVILNDDGIGNDQYGNDNIYTSEDITVETGDETGTFNLDYEIDDLANNEITGSFNVVVDTIDSTPPSGTITNPSNGQIIKDDYEFRINAWDNVGVSSVEIKIQNNNYQASHNQQTGYWTHTLDTTNFDDGVYNIDVDIQDENGLLTEIGPKTFTIDNNGPSLSVNTPQNNDLLTNDAELSVNSQDEVGVKYVKYWVDNSEKVDMSESWGTWTDTLDTTAYQDGDHVIHFKAEDEAGHVNTVDIPVKFDNTRPTSNLKSPNVNEYLEDTYKFKATASDAVGVESVVLNLNNSDNNWSFDMSYNSDSSQWQYSLDTTTRSEGRYEATVTAIDVAGHNYTSTNVTFTIDNTAPSLSINDPQKDEILTDEAELSINSYDEVGLEYVKYRVDNSEKVDMTQSSGNWTAILDTTEFDDGNHIIHFKVEDEAGHVTTKDVSVIFDNTGPLSYLESPNAEEYIEDTYTFKAKATDEIGIESVELNIHIESDLWNYDMTYNSDSGYWEKPVDTTHLPESKLNANVTAIDDAGHSQTSSDLTFYVDNTIPTMEVLSPGKEEIIGEDHPEDPLIQVNSEDNLEVSNVEYRIDNSVWKQLEYQPFGTGEYNWAVELNTSMYSDGDHDFYLRTTDNAGHENMKNFEITIDNSKPSVANVNPEFGEYIEGKYNFRVTAGDKVGVSSVVMELSDNLSDPESNHHYVLEKNENSGYWETLINTNNLQDGDKEVNITAVDYAGHKNNIEKQFFIDNNKPELGIDNPKTDEIIFGEYNLSVKTFDVNGIKNVKYRVDSSSWANLESGSERWTSLLDTTRLSEGGHTIKFRSTDMAGHTSEQDVQVTVDNEDPEISIVNPQSDQFVEDELKIQLKVEDNIGIDRVKVNVYSLISSGNYSDKWTMNATYNPGSGYYETSIDTNVVSEGGHWKVDAEASDMVEHTAKSKDVKFKVDNHHPSLTIQSPRDGDHIQGIVKINYSAQDAFPTYTEYKVDDSGWVPAVVELNTTELADGKHTIDFRSTDTADKSVTQSIEVYVDNNEPKAEIASPIQDQFVEKWFKFKVSGKDQVGVEEVSLNMMNQTREISYDSSSGYYIYELDTRNLEDGVYNVSAIVKDKIGHENITDKIKFKVDNNKPELEINSPNHNEYINGSVKLNVTAHDEFLKDVKYTVDGTSFTQIDEELDTTSLSEGTHKITVRATDLNRQEEIKSISVIVDNKDPRIRVTNPEISETISGTQKIEVFGGQDIQNMTLSIPELDEGVSKPMEKLPASESYQYMLNSSKLSKFNGSGKYEGTITAIDKTNEEITKRFPLNVDNEGPQINKTNPGNKSSEMVKFTTKINDWSGIKTVEINIDGRGWKEMIYSGNDTYEYAWETTIEDNGDHTYTIRAVDENGNEQKFSDTVKIDNPKDYWKVFQNNIPGFSFLFIIILTIFLGYLTRNEIRERLPIEEEENGEDEDLKEDEGEDSGFLSKLKSDDEYSSEEKSESSVKNKFIGILPGFGQKKEKKTKKKGLKKLKKSESDEEKKEVSSEEESEESKGKTDRKSSDLKKLDINSDIIQKLIKEDISTIDDLTDFGPENLKKYTDLTDREIQKLENELESKGYSLKGDEDLMSSVLDADI